MPTPLQLSYCAQTVREHDRDRYLCALFAPAHVREAWFALFALQEELSGIPYKVSEEMLGFIRYAWWREALDEIYARQAPRRHPVMEALAQAIAAFALPKALFDRVLAAHEQCLLKEEWVSAEAAQAHCRDTDGAVFALCAHAVGDADTQPWSEAGTAWGLLTLARGKEASKDGTQELRTQWMECAGACLKKAGGAGGVDASLAAFLRAGGFYLQRLRAGKATASPAARLLLTWKLWLA